MTANILRVAALGAAVLLAACANLAANGGTTSSGASASVISGAAYALDGDSVIVNGRRLNLWGIDAPDFGTAQGWYARGVLDDMIGRGGSLTCTVKRRSSNTDRALCSNSRSGDVALAMLRSGWAIVARTERTRRDADTALLDVYERAEREARQRGAGLWAQGPRG